MARAIAVVLLCLGAGCLDFEKGQRDYCAKNPGVCGTVAGDGGGDGGAPADAGAAGAGGADAGGFDAGAMDAGGVDGGLPGAASRWLTTLGDFSTTSLALRDAAATSGGDLLGIGSWTGKLTAGGVAEYPAVSSVHDAFLVRYAPDGTFASFRQFTTPGTDCIGLSAGADSSGNTYALLGSAGRLAAFDAGAPGFTEGGYWTSFAPDASTRFVVSFEGNSGVGSAVSLSAAVVGPDGSSLVVGQLGGSLHAPSCPGLSSINGTGGTFFLIFDATGVCRGGSMTYCNAATAPVPLDVAVDDVTGEFYVLSTLGGFQNETCNLVPLPSGFTPESDGYNTLALFHYSASGAFLNYLIFDGRQTPATIITAQPGFLAAHDGGLWLATSFSGTVSVGTADAGSTGGTDLLLVQIDPRAPAADPTSLKTFGSSGDDTARGLRFDPGGRLWLAAEVGGGGLTLGGVALDSGSTLPDGGPARGIFLAAFDGTRPQAPVQYVAQIPSTLDVSWSALSISPDGGVFVGGQFAGTVDFGLDAGPAQAVTQSTSSAFLGRWR